MLVFFTDLRQFKNAGSQQAAFGELLAHREQFALKLTKCAGQAFNKIIVSHFTTLVTTYFLIIAL
ncbi:hypothetical protein ACFSKS_08200 [Pseudocitrobacter faecalis]